MRDPKILFPLIKKIFQACCLFLAIFWITFFSTQYTENRDTILVSMKTFNVDPLDQYPTFSLCFKGDRFHWFNDEEIFKSHNLDPTQYELMLKGEPAFKDVFDDKNKTYFKEPVTFSDGRNVTFEDHHLR